jgi:hypothetical protein
MRRKSRMRPRQPLLRRTKIITKPLDRTTLSDTLILGEIPGPGSNDAQSTFFFLPDLVLARTKSTLASIFAAKARGRCKVRPSTKRTPTGVAHTGRQRGIYLPCLQLGRLRRIGRDTCHHLTDGGREGCFRTYRGRVSPSDKCRG